MRNRSVILGALLGACSTWALQAGAEPTGGGWYAVEGATSSVVEFTAGGDLSGVPDFATGIPGGANDMCYGGPNGDLFVSAANLNAVYRITNGGDFSATPPYAYQFPGGAAYALDCTGDRVLVSSQGSGAVWDITTGGDMTNATPFAENLPPDGLGLLTDSSGTIWFASQNGGIWDITAGGDFAAVAATYPYDLAGAFGMGSLIEAGGSLYFLHIFPAEVFDFTGLTAGDPLSSATSFTGGLNVFTGAASDGTNLFLLNPCPGPIGDFGSCGYGTIWDATAGGDLSLNTPYAEGHAVAAFFSEGLTYIHTCGDNIVWPNSAEVCDEGAESATCNGNCTIPACGDEWTNVVTGEECDDGANNSDVTPDACREDCTAPSCGDGVVDSGEDCDEGASNSDVDADACRTTCVPASCGDDVVDTGEECDDGNTDDGDGCDANCADEGGMGGGGAGGMGGGGEGGDDTGGDGGSDSGGNGTGATGTGASGTGGSGDGGEGGGGDDNLVIESDDDCGCRVAGAPTGPDPKGWIALGLLGLAALRRRSRRS